MDVGNKKGPRGDINVTPLIDVVLVLLIIFMVLTPSMLKHLTATVPQEGGRCDRAAAGRGAHHGRVHRQARADPERRAGRAPRRWPTAWPARLRAGPPKVVFFKADDDAPYGEVVHLMESPAARGAGAKTLAVVTTD